MTVVLSTLLLLCMASCKKNNSNSADSPESTPVAIEMRDISLTGTVRNTLGIPLVGVAIASGEASTTSADDGTFSLSRAATVGSRAVVRFEKEGYFSVVRSGVRADEMHIETVMQAKGNSVNSSTTSFVAAESRTLSAGGMKVAIPASSLVRADGSAYTGSVNADLLYLAPDNDNFADLMPGGDLAGIRADNRETQLISYGMSGISLTDNAGNTLQLKDGARSSLTFPVPDGMNNNPPATIPLWLFDDERGIWTEKGTATLQGEEYVGEANGFAWYNLDVPTDRATISGKATDCNGDPVAYVKITVEQTSAFTNRYGEYSVYVPANTAVRATVKSRDYSGYSPEVSYSIAGASNGSTVTQDFDLPCRPTQDEPVEGATVSMSQGSVTYLMEGSSTDILTFDNYGRRLRWDSDFGTDGHSVVIFDDIAKTCNMCINNKWIDLPYESSEAYFRVFLFNDEMYKIIPGVQNLPSETIAGKVCTVYGIPSRDDCVRKYAGWNGLMMLSDNCESISLLATEVRLNIPSNAFTKTKDIF